MNIKTIASAYFVPIKEVNPYRTIWVNLARIEEIIELDENTIRIIYPQKKAYRDLTGISKIQLLEELEVLRAKQISI